MFSLFTTQHTQFSLSPPVVLLTVVYLSLVGSKLFWLAPNYLLIIEDDMRRRRNNRKSPEAVTTQ
jgi:hypothetical protein